MRWHRSSLVHVSMFTVWLSSAEVGVWFGLFWRSLGLAAGVLPLARRVLPSVGPWLEALLTERCCQAGLERGPGEQDLWALEAADLTLQPFAPGELPSYGPWLEGLLVEELARLVRLAEAPTELLCHPGWLTWELRHWSLAVSLARLGQVYAELAAQDGEEAAGFAFQAAAAQVWQRAVGERLAA